MKKILFTALLIQMTLVVSAQRDESPFVNRFRAGAGFFSYQILPIQFEDPQTGDIYRRGDRMASPVYYLGWTKSTANRTLHYGVNLGYELSTADLTSNGETFLGGMEVQHWTFMGVLKWDYWKSDKFYIGGGAMLGFGMDIAKFSNDVPNFNYTTYDYHYQLDGLSLRIGRSYGIEAAVGYGALGAVRAGVFYRL